MRVTWNENVWVRCANAAILLGLTGYGAYLRGYASDSSLYDTEILAREQAGESVLYILKHGAAPIYELFVKFCLLLGDTEMALRLPSLLAGLLTILAAYGLVRHLHSRTAGLVAAALVTFNPYLIHLGEYASPDAFLVLCVLMAVWCLFRVLETRSWYAWLGFAVFAALAASPHIKFLPALGVMVLVSMLYLAFNRNAGRLRWRMVMVVLLGGCAALGPALLVERGHDPRAIYQFDTGFMQPADDVPASNATERPRGGGQVEKDVDTGKVRYRLTHYDCIEYLKRFFWNQTNWAWAGLIVIAVWGAFDLVYRIPAAATVILGALAGGPLATFLFTTSHALHFRHFSYLAILSTILVALGLCVLPHFLSRLLAAPRSIRLWRRQPAPPARRTVTVANLLYPAIIIGLAIPAAPYINEAFQSYPVYGYVPLHLNAKNRAPVQDWKRLFETIGSSVTGDDALVFMAPKGGYGPRYARYYLDRVLGHGEQDRPTMQFAAPTPDLVRELAQTRPNGNLWFIGTLHHRVDDFKPLLKAAGAQERDFLVHNKINGLRLFYLGAPVTNMALHGGFEAGWKADELPEGASLDPIWPFEGKRSLRIDVPNGEAGSRFIPLQRSVVSYRLRNNGFEAWQGGTPVGWLANAAAQAAMDRDTAGFQGSIGLRLRPGTETAILRQTLPVGLAPGRTLEVQAMGIATTPDDLHLVVRYSGPGFQETHHISHPGEGDHYTWYLMKGAVDIPANADPESIALEVWRTPGGEGDVVVDNVQLRVTEPGGRLDPTQRYVVSMNVRTDGLQDKRGSKAARVGCARLRWTTGDGETGQYELFRFANHKVWRPMYATFRAGREIPLDTEELALEVGIEAGSGTIWVDAVQWAEGMHPAPFATTFRLPHDERLGAVDLSKHAVKSPW